MSPRITKSRNLDVYPYFMNYDDPHNIPYERIAENLGRTPNSLRGMIRSAHHNSTIYLALRKQGYEDHQFPEWFALPEKPLEHRRAETAGTRISAEERSGVGKRSEPKRGDIQDTRGVAREGSAERPSALSMRSAPPVHTYRFVQPTYQRPANPYLEEMSQRLIKALDEEMNESLERMKKRWEPPKPMTPNQFKVQLEVARISHYMQLRRNAQVWFLMNIQQSGSNSKPIDVDELKEQLGKPFEELRSKAEAYDDDAKTVKAFEVISQLFKDGIPKMPPVDALLREREAAARERRKSDREAMKELAKIMAENRRRRNMPLELFEREHRKMMDGFYENLERMVRGV